MARPRVLDRALAQADSARVTSVNAGLAVEGPGGTFAETLPCSRGQPCTGPILDDTVQRRPLVGRTHFCPSQEGDVHG